MRCWKMKKEELSEEEPVAAKMYCGLFLGCALTSFYEILSPKFCNFLLIRFYPPPQQRAAIADWFAEQASSGSGPLEAAIRTSGGLGEERF